MKIQLPKKYSQNDPSWKNKTQGTKGTIGAYGCLITDVAMMLCLYGHDETPATLNDKLKSNGGYANGNLFVWGAINNMYKDVAYGGQVQTFDPLTKSQMDFIKGKIDKGYPVILQIDTIPSTSQLDEHWILAIDYEGDDFMVQDPWDGATKRITSWGVKPQDLIYAYAYYTGKPISISKPTMTIEADLYEKLVNGATVRKEVAEYLNIVNPDQASRDQLVNVIGGIKSEATTLRNQIGILNGDLANKAEQVNRLKDQLLNSESLRTSLSKELNDTISKITSITKVYENQVSVLNGKLEEMGKSHTSTISKLETLKTEYQTLKKQSIEGLTAGQVFQLWLQKIFT